MSWRGPIWPTGGAQVVVFDDEEVNTYDAQDTKMLVTRKAILKGWYWILDRAKVPIGTV